MVRSNPVMDVEVVANYGCNTGEGPLWDHRRGVLYWVDIYNGRLFRYDPAEDTHDIRYENDAFDIGGITLHAGGGLLLFGEKGRVMSWEDGRTTTVVDELPPERHTRFNDVIADPEGRVFCGTKATEQQSGRLYRLDLDGSFHPVVEDVGLSNGLGFTLDLDNLYFTDSADNRIYKYDYDKATGEISNRRTFVDTSGKDGIPDGLTVDARGDVWSAQYEDEAIYRYGSDGTEEEKIPIPGAVQTTSVMFGGVGLDELFVTSGGGHLNGDQGTNAGALFRVEPGVTGRR